MKDEELSFRKLKPLTLGGREEMLAAVMLAAVIHRVIDDFTHGSISLYYESIKREPKTRPVNESVR
jgi:hypothetical protein